MTRYLILLLLCFIALLGCAPFETTSPKIAPQAVNGVLDLTHWEFEKDGRVKLEGEWEFYWQRLLTPADFAQPQPQKAEFFPVPGDWNSYVWNNQTLPSEGYATFRLRIKLNPPKEFIALKVQEIDSAYRLWFNEQLLLANGQVGQTKAETVPQYLPKTGYIRLEPMGQDIQLILQIANFDYKDGGIYRDLTLGTVAQIERETYRSMAFQTFLFGSLLFMSMYHLGLYLLRRKDVSPLYFGIFCFLLAMRSIEPGERILSYFFGLGFETVIKISHLTVFPPAVVFLMFLESLFPQEVSKKLLRPLQVLVAIYSVIVLTTPARIYSYLLVYSQIVVVGAVIFGLYILIMASFRQREGAISFMVGLFILAVTVINDLLFDNGLINTMFLAPFGTFIFTFSQSLILSARSAKAFDNVETLSKELYLSNERLADYNQTLTEKVKERTLELQDKVKTLEQMEQILRENEEKYRNLVERANDGIIIIQDEVIKYANPRITELIGYSADQILNTHFFDYLTTAELPKVLERYHRRIKGEPLEAIQETVLKHHDGHELIIETNAGLITYQGQPAELVFIRDISERKRVEAALQQRNHELDLFNRTTHMFSSSLDLNEVLETVLGSMRYLLNVTAASLWLIENDKLVCHHASGSQNEQVKGWRLPLGHGIVGWVAQHGKSALVADAEKDERHFKDVDKSTGLELHSILSIPLQVSGEVIGVLNLADIQIDRFTAHDLRLLEPIATAAATSIQNARLYTTAQQELTERKRAEEALRLSEEMYSTLIGNIQDGVFLIQDEKFSFVNEAFAKMVGYTTIEIMGMYFEDFIAPEDAEMIMSNYVQLVEGEDVPSEYEFHILHRDDTTRVLVNMNVGLITYHGQLASIGTIKDVTEAKQSKNLLRIQRDLGVALSTTSDLIEALHQILDAACRIEGFDSGGIYLVSERSGQIGLVVHEGLNDEFVEYVAYFSADSPHATLIRAGEPIYTHFARTTIFPPQVQLMEQLRALAVVPVKYEGRVIASLNLTSHTHDEIALRTQKMLETIAVQIGGVIARIKVGAYLRESQRNLQSLFDTLEDFLFILDLNGNILQVNPVVCKQLGYLTEELTCLNIVEMHPPDQRQEVAEMLNDGLAKIVKAYLIPLVTKEGKLMPVETKITRGKWNNRQVFFGTSRDITERQRAEEALAKREAYLAALVRVQQQLMASDESTDPYMETLALLGQVSHTSRVYIFENSTSANGQLLMCQRAEWVAEGIVPELDNPELQDFPYANGFQRWQDVLEHGGIISGKIADFSEEERQILEPQAILSILVLPLTVNGNFCGFIGFDDCLEAREWDASEVSLLWAAASAISIFKEQQQTKQALKKSYQQFSTVVSSISDHIYMSELTKDGQSLNGFISPNVEILTGYAMEKFLEDWSFWPKTVIHQADQASAQVQAMRFAKGQNSETEYRLVRPDGQIIWVRDSGRVEWNEAQQTFTVYGVVSDITERKRMENELRATYQNLRRLTDRLQSEMQLAQQIQQSLLPPTHPNWTDLDMVCYNMPAQEVGGDLYAYYAFELQNRSEARKMNTGKLRAEDFNQEPVMPSHLLPISPSRYAVAIGDVSGKGMPAALLMAVSVALFRSFVSRGFPPGTLLSYLDRALVPYTKTTRQNCALTYLEITPPSVMKSGQGKLRAANAGCVTPIIKRADGSVEWLEIGGMPLGVGLGAESGYQEISISLIKGDIIILTSDGVVEANNQTHELFGFERLEQAVKAAPQSSATAMLEYLKAEITTFADGTEPHDDLTIVVIQV